MTFIVHVNGKVQPDLIITAPTREIAKRAAEKRFPDPHADNRRGGDPEAWPPHNVQVEPVGDADIAHLHGKVQLQEAQLREAVRQLETILAIVSPDTDTRPHQCLAEVEKYAAAYLAVERERDELNAKCAQKTSEIAQLVYDYAGLEKERDALKEQLAEKDEELTNITRTGTGLLLQESQARELELMQQLADAKRYGAEKDHTATVFMNQVKKLQADLEFLKTAARNACAATRVVLHAADVTEQDHFNASMAVDKLVDILREDER